MVTLIAAVPYKIHTVLTDNGIKFRYPARCADVLTARDMTHMFDLRCRDNDIEHSLTNSSNPWTNGKDDEPDHQGATVQRYHDDSHQELAQHLNDFVSAYNFGRRLKTLKGLTLYCRLARSANAAPQCRRRGCGRTRSPIAPRQSRPGCCQ